MVRPITRRAHANGFYFTGGLFFGSYSAETISVLGTQLFIATQGASGDTYSQSGSGDTYSQAANDDDYTQGGGIA